MKFILRLLALICIVVIVGLLTFLPHAAGNKVFSDFELDKIDKLIDEYT
jgi:K+-transporting ATPase A subunit